MSVLSKMFDRQRGLCFYCKGAVWLPPRENIDDACARLGATRNAVRKYFRANREHLHRRADGGSDSHSNLVMTCVRCNSTRDTATVAEHKARMNGKPRRLRLPGDKNSNIPEFEDRSPPKMKLVIVESPYAGDVERNIEYARECVRDSLNRGEAPIASHLLYTQPGVLDDTVPAERTLGIDAGLAWRKVADGSVVYTDLGISDGMRYGISAAMDAGLPVEYRKIR